MPHIQQQPRAPSAALVDSLVKRGARAATLEKLSPTRRQVTHRPNK